VKEGHRNRCLIAATGDFLLENMLLGM